MGSIINDVQVGQNTRVNIQSVSHGRKRVPLAGTLQYSNKESSGVIGEFDNRYGVIAWQTFDGVDVTMEVQQADIADLDAMIMDQDPNGVIINLDKAQISKNIIWANYTGRNTGYGYAADYAEGLVCNSSGGPQSVNAPTKNSYGWTGTKRLHIEGKNGQVCCIQYNRFVNSPTYVTADDIALSGSSGTFPYAPVAFPINGGLTPTTQKYIQCLKNGVPFTNFTITGTGLTLGETPASGAVYEFWTVVQTTVA